MSEDERKIEEAGGLQPALLARARAWSKPNLAGAGRYASSLHSFWIGGYESGYQITRQGRRIDMIAATQHDRNADRDYGLLAQVGIWTARDAARWHLIDRGGRYDFSSLDSQLKAARRHRVQVIWTLCHYGWPDDLDLLNPDFIKRFARYCRATARYIADHCDCPPLFTPVNEISFLTWALCTVQYIQPFLPGRELEVKRQLVRAAIVGAEAIWSVLPSAQMVTTDPLIHVVTPLNRPDCASAAQVQREAQFEAVELLSGAREPELGGSPRHVGMFGLNYYHANQFEHPNVRLRWEDSPRDPRWASLCQLLREAHERVRRPLLIAETSHFGVGRAAWLREIAHEADQSLACGVPLGGVCLYPILDRPDWDNPEHWHNSGLWDLVPDKQGRLQRVLHHDYAQEFKRAQQLLAQRGCI